MEQFQDQRSDRLDDPNLRDNALPIVPITGPIDIRFDDQSLVTVRGFATESQDKLRECDSLGLKLPCLPVVITERQTHGSENKRLLRGEFKEVVMAIAAEKAHEAFRILGEPGLVEDTGLVVKVAPVVTGHNIKAWCVKDEEGNTPLLDLLVDMARQRGVFEATAYVTLAVSNGSGVKVFYSEVRGRIAESRRGSNGFGWDSYFIPENDPALGSQGIEQNEKTNGEMTPEERRLLFPLRRKALGELMKSLAH